MLDDAVFKYLQPELGLTETDKRKNIMPKEYADEYLGQHSIVPLILKKYMEFRPLLAAVENVAERAVSSDVLNPPRRQMKFSESLHESAFTGGKYLGQAADNKNAKIDPNQKAVGCSAREIDERAPAKKIRTQMLQKDN